jgi:hypothetical protein
MHPDRQALISKRLEKQEIRRQKITLDFDARDIPSAKFPSRTGSSPEHGPRFFEGFKGICDGDRTSETGGRPKIGL